VLANWEYVKRYQKPNGHLPIMIDGKGEGLYVHWCTRDPLRALGAVTYAHNAYAIYAHTLDDAWLRGNLHSINLAMEYLVSFVTPDGQVSGAGFYAEIPTRIEWDGVTQCYAADALQRIAALSFLRDAIGQWPKTVMQGHVLSDSAWYQNAGLSLTSRPCARGAASGCARIHR